jgi:hypothetical protein
MMLYALPWSFDHNSKLRLLVAGWREKTKVRVAKLALWSVTRTVTVKDPGVAEEVPAMMPEDDKEIPDGKDPESNDQTYGVVPPVAVSWTE